MTNPVSSSLDRPVSITVISGFLGSGKTTLIRRLVSDPSIGPRLAVLVNDVGELGLDPSLIRSAGEVPLLRVTELVSGCICCSLAGDFVAALAALSRGEGLARRPEHILVEPSGLARASEVSFSINAIGFEQPVRADVVVTLVDAWNARRAHTEDPDLFEDQVRTADLLLLNKRDLFPDELDQQALVAWLRPFAPRASLIWCEHGDIDPTLLFGDIDLHELPAPAPLSAADSQPLVPVSRARAALAHRFGSLTLDPPAGLDRLRFEDFLDAQADHIFRIKGIVDLRTAEGLVPTLVQAVGDRVELDPIAKTSPLYAIPRRLIFIGNTHALDPIRLSRALHSAGHESMGK